MAGLEINLEFDLDFRTKGPPKEAPKGPKQQVTGILISIIIYVNNEIIS